MTACGLCGLDAGPAHLCDRDTNALAGRLARLPDLFAELAEHLIPRRTGAAERVLTGPAGPRSPLNEDVLDLRHGGIALTLESWRADVQRVRWPGRGAPPLDGGMDHRVMAACRWLGMELDWIAVEYPAAGDLAREVRQMEGAVLAIVGAAPPPALHIGQCIAVVDDSGTVCGADLRHRQGDPEIRCRACHCAYRSGQDLLLLRHYQPEKVA